MNFDQRGDNNISPDSSSGFTGGVNHTGAKRKRSFLQKGSLAYLTALYASGTTTGSILRMISGVLAARFVEPATLGLFNGIGLVNSYAVFLHIGVLSALDRELPYYIGKGEREKAYELASAAQAWALLLGICTSALLLILALTQAVLGRWQLAAGWGTHAIGVFHTFFIMIYLLAIYRTQGEFGKLGAASVVRETTHLIMVVTVWLFGFYGLCIRNLAFVVINSAFLWRWRPLRVRSRWNWKNFRHLLKIGLPIFGVVQLYAYWEVLNLTLVLKIMGIEGMGLYSLAAMSGMISMLPQTMSKIIFPRMALQFGSTENINDLFRMAVRPIIVLILVIIPIVYIAWMLLPTLVEFILPKYVDGIKAAQWTLLLSIIICMTPINNIFNVVKRQELYAIAIITGIAGYLVSLYLLIGKEPYLAGFPQSMLIGQSIFIIMCYAFIFMLKVKANKSPHT
ncbi:MAG: oligosaccharide flippase family protein [candidate division Zixibacteria bacterium]|nr:oligosaccharide flippase family protein [Candidatus Tariuqbacter arcticus]